MFVPPIEVIIEKTECSEDCCDNHGYAVTVGLIDCGPGAIILRTGGPSIPDICALLRQTVKQLKREMRDHPELRKGP